MTKQTNTLEIKTQNRIYSPLTGKGKNKEYSKNKRIYDLEAEKNNRGYSPKPKQVKYETKNLEEWYDQLPLFQKELNIFKGEGK